jgi:hypothetical protein
MRVHLGALLRVIRIDEWGSVENVANNWTNVQ